MATQTPNALFVVIEGIDGAGKSTLIPNLKTWMESSGLDVLTTFEPTRGPYGEQLRRTFLGPRLSLHEELTLFVEDRKEHVADVIKPALNRGTSILCDRYWLSTCAYQGARGADIQAIIRAHAFAPEPDFAFILDLDVETALNRLQEQGRQANSFEIAESLRSTRAIFLELADQLPWAHRLDASVDPETLLAACQRVIQPKLPGLPNAAES